VKDDNIFTSQVTGCQVHTIENAIWPLFADWITNTYSTA